MSIVSSSTGDTVLAEPNPTAFFPLKNIGSSVFGKSRRQWCQSNIGYHFMLLLTVPVRSQVRAREEVERRAPGHLLDAPDPSADLIGEENFLSTVVQPQLHKPDSEEMITTRSR